MMFLERIFTGWYVGRTEYISALGAPRFLRMPGCQALAWRDWRRWTVVFNLVRFFGVFAVFDETWLLGLGKNSYIAFGLMRNGLVSRTTGFCFTHNG